MPKKLISLDELSRFKDKLDIELDKKANVDGNYPTLTAGLADNLTPYGEDSGAEQTNPFISNGTGTNNNTEIVTVGDYGLLQEKQGNTLVVNQLVDYTNISTTTLDGITITNNNDGSFTLNGTATGNVVFIMVNSTLLTTGHKYLNRGINNITGVTYRYFGGSYAGITNDSVIQYDGATYTGNFVIYISNGTNLSNIKIIPQLVDITSWDADIITDLTANPSHFSWYYNGSLAYNTGSLENANGVKLVGTKRNLFDEEYEGGGIDASTGLNVSHPHAFRTKNKYIVPPNVDLHLHSGISISSYTVYEYDVNNNFIRKTEKYQNNSTYQLSPNTTYVRMAFWTANSGWGTNPPTKEQTQIVLSLYYTPAQGGEGYDKYYPYEEPYIVDTGSEVLRKAGSVKDYKEPNGTIHRLIGSYTFTGNEKVTEGTVQNGDKRFLIALPNDCKSIPVTDVANAIFSGTYNLDSGNEIYYNKVGYSINLLNFNFYDSSIQTLSAFISFITGKTIYYELATPTTEQGTPFAENLPINDYGMLYWLDENDNLVGIPQGAKIFFPTNYKGFVDDMYSRVDGDSSDYVIQSELAQYVKQVDLSSEITDVAGLTYTVKKAYKTGSIVQLSIKAKNETGSTISSNSTLFSLSNNLYGVYMIAECILGYDVRTIVIDSGNVSIPYAVNNNTTIYINISYAVA